MSNAFASVLQARPCPVFGRPIHLWGSPLDYGPVLLLMPFGFHLAVDTLPSGELKTAAAGLPWLCPAFAFLPVLASPYLPFLPPTTLYRRFWIRRPSSERPRDLNPPDQRAAQREIHAGRFHRHVRAAGFPQPVRQRQQPPRGGRKDPHLAHYLS